MRLRQLVLREIWHRKLSFGLALLSVSAAIGCLVGSETLLTSDQIQTERILAAKATALNAEIGRRQQEVEAAGQELEEEIREQMLGLGFNLLILPADQDLSEWHLTGQLTATMPESYAEKLAQSEIITINHLLPAVTGRVRLQHGKVGTEAVLQGTRGEIPLLHRASHPPLLDAVTPGEAVVGHRIQQALQLEVGDEISIEGRPFQVTRLHPERGSTDDVTVWIDLAQAQQVLGLQNLLHAMLALECGCVGDRISQVRADVAAILPGVQVVERYSTALARAEARDQAKLSAEQTLAAERASGERALRRERAARDELYARHAGLAGALIPLTMVAAGIWIGVLALNNVRQRTAEIGLLRALGLSGKQILTVFLARVAALGLIGGVVGAGAGLAVGAMLSGHGGHASVSLSDMLATGPLRWMIAVAPLTALLLAIVSSWLPILLAVRQDPAAALQADR